MARKKSAKKPKKANALKHIKPLTGFHKIKLLN
jgi:hypothetical protein